VATVAATVWVPVEPRARETVIGVIERQDGTREPIAARMPPPRFDWDWVWRAHRPADPNWHSHEWVEFEIGDTVVAEDPQARRLDAVLQVALIAILGGLLTVLTHTLARRREAVLGTIPAALPVDDAAPEGDAPAGGTPGRGAPRRVAVVAASAVLAGLAGFALGPCRADPSTVERWVVPADLPKDHSPWNPAPPIRIGIQEVSVHASVGHDLAFAGVITGSVLDAAQPRLRTVIANRNPEHRSLVAEIHADPDAPTASVVAVMGWLRGNSGNEHKPFAEIECFGWSPPTPNTPPPSGGTPRDPAPLPIVQTAEWYMVGPEACFDVHIARDGTLRARTSGEAGSAVPIPTDLARVAADLRAAATRQKDVWNPAISSLVMFIHADADTPWYYVEQVCRECAKIGIWRLAFVVQPPPADAGGK
jgi:biopolymer transport protein ExbD